jgi:hypothetical protein
MSSSSGYVAIPRCPVIFYGANYPDFAAFMRVHMHGLCLSGVLSGEVSCPPCPTPHVAPIPLSAKLYKRAQKCQSLSQKLASFLYGR